MAKKSVRTNAFGMTPDSFETTKMKQGNEENAFSSTPETPVTPTVAPANDAPVTVQPAAVPEQEKREYKKIGKDKVRVHFLAKAQLLERVDAYGEAKDKNRTQVFLEAIREYLEREGY